ncbi:MAG: DegV family protein [Eubacterium sp.]|nr:DegV family protein [Eubacterium sp.]
MKQYLIFTDSACDMPQHLYDEYDVRIIPMEYTLNGEQIEFHTEAADRDQYCDTLYAALREGADIHTSQITPYNYIEAWKPELEAGSDILYLAFSSGLSATYENACNAAAQLADDYPDRKIVVVDTLAGTSGQGIFVHAALLNRANGMTIEENEAWLIEKRPYLCHRFMVGDLNYLHKGGRVSAAVAIVGSVLNIKPLLIIDDEGKLQVVAKARGQKPALKRLIQSYKHEMGVPDVPKLVYIGHTSLYEDAKALKKMVEEVVEEGTIVEIQNMSPIIGAHTGPAFFSICGWGWHRVEEA